VFTRGLVVRRRGTVINVSSVSAIRPLIKVVAYGAAKAAITNLTQWLAVHFARTGVRVNAIVPGFFLTEQNRSLLTKGDGSLSPRGDKIIAQTPMGRFGEPAELLGALLWLTDDRAAGFVTGAVVPVDGGFTAYSGV
jgi:NAD(P)-dependent dehydrogenase (short-subunit alcohol dehydrogenase family)